MMGAAGTNGRGPESPAFCVWTGVTRAATETAGLTDRFVAGTAGRLAAAVLWAALARRCFRFAGTVLAKPITTRSWKAKVKAVIRDAVARDNLIIECYHSPYR